MAKFILHIGYPKTGTTYLQRKIFPQIVDNFIVITPEFENCNVNIKRLKHSIQSGMIPQKTRQKLAGHDVLLSIEGLLFDAMRYVEDGRFAPKSWPQALKGLRSLTDGIDQRDVAIVLYLRRQEDLLHSLYAESKTFHFNQIAELNTLEKYVDVVIAGGESPEEPGYYYNYLNIINEINDAFPTSVLHIRFYEDLDRNAEDEIEFWSKICERPLRLITGKENARRLGDDEKWADEDNIRFRLLRIKQKYFPDLKLPNILSRLIEIYLSKVTLGDRESIRMTDQMKLRLREKFGPINTCLTRDAHLPRRLCQEYFVIEETER